MQFMQSLETRRLFSTSGADPTFGTAGQTVIDFSSIASRGDFINEFESTITQDAAGRTYVIAPLDDYSDKYAIARLDRAGKLDPTYGKGGIVSLVVPLDINGSDFGQLCAVDASGRLYVFINNEIQRLTPAGGLDSTFGKGGKIDVDELDVKLLTIDSAGFPLLAGTITTSGPTTTEIIRLGETGKLDDSFHYVAPNFGGTNARSRTNSPVSLKVLNNGELMLQGSTYYRAYVADEMQIEPWNGEFTTRLHADGSVDTAYAQKGLQQEAAYGTDIFYPSYYPNGLGNDGSAYVGLSVETDDTSASPQGEFYRLTPDGKVETVLRSADRLGRKGAEQTPALPAAGDRITGVDGSELETASSGSGELDPKIAVTKSYPDDHPAATLAVRNLKQRRTQSVVFSVSWRGTAAIDAASLGNGDVVVDLPDRTSRTAHFTGYQTQADGSVKATYKLSSGDGVWDAGDNGIYAIRTKARQVTDINGVSDNAQELGLFEVRIS